MKASEIKPGDKILLRDLKTVVTIAATDKEAPGGNELVILFWEHEGQRRHMPYQPHEEIEVRS